MSQLLLDRMSLRKSHEFYKGNRDARPASTFGPPPPRVPATVEFAEPICPMCNKPTADYPGCPFETCRYK